MCILEHERSIIESLGLDAMHADDQLREVWRRHTRNPDERGNPQLTALLQLRLHTHSVSHTSEASHSGYTRDTRDTKDTSKASYSAGSDELHRHCERGVGDSASGAVPSIHSDNDSNTEDASIAADGAAESAAAAIAAVEAVEAVPAAGEGSCEGGSTPEAAEGVEIATARDICADFASEDTAETQCIEKCEAVPVEELCVALSPLLIPVVCKISP